MSCICTPARVLTVLGIPRLYHSLCLRHVQRNVEFATGCLAYGCPPSLFTAIRSVLIRAAYCVFHFWPLRLNFGTSAGLSAGGMNGDSAYDMIRDSFRLNWRYDSSHVYISPPAQ